MATPVEGSFGLFIIGNPDQLTVGSTPLSIFGATTDTQIASVDFYVAGEAGTLESGLNLFAKGPDSGTDVRNMNLYVRGEYLVSTGSLALLIQGDSPIQVCPLDWAAWEDEWEDSDNYWNCEDYTNLISGSIPLFLKGTPVGSVTRGMNLYLQCLTGGSVSLFIQGPAVAVDTPDGLALFVKGAQVIEQGMYMSLPNVVDVVISTPTMQMYVNGW